MLNLKCRNSPIRAPEKSIPLFVDVGVEVIVSGAFSNNLIENKNIYTSLPIIVSSIYYPNIFFSLIPKEQLNEVLSQINGIQYLDYNKDFSFEKLNNHRNEKDKYFAFYLPESNDNNNDNYSCKDTDQIYRIINQMLNPLGIGAFYDQNSSGFNLFSHITQRVDKMKCEFVPYSMEAIRQMLFQYKDEEFSVFSIASLMILQYPLPKIIIPRPDLNLLRDRFIFSYFIINNPPLINDENSDIKSFLIDENKNSSGAIMLTTVKPYQWIHISLHTFNEHFKPNEIIEALISPFNYSTSLEHINDLNMFNYCKSCSNVRKTLYKDEVDIMHPEGGYLWLKGIDLQKNDPPIAVDVFLRKINY